MERRLDRMERLLMRLSLFAEVLIIILLGSVYQLLLESSTDLKLIFLVVLLILAYILIRDTEQEVLIKKIKSSKQ